MVERHVEAFWIGGAFAFSAMLVSFIQMYLHLRWNSHPELRKYILRILLMVPIYAFDAFLGLRYKDVSLYFDVLRETYEALVIYSFFMLLVEYVGGQETTMEVIAVRPQQKHLTPFCCLPPWRMGSRFFYNTKLGTLQYCVVKPLMSVLIFILTNTGGYEDGSIEWANAYPYIAFINNASQIWSMYCLVVFYVVTKEQLTDLKPVPKFLCVKAVVFFTFWQSVLLAILVKIGIITPTETYTIDNVVSGLQDFIICVEMFVAAVAHHFAFNYAEFHDEQRHQHQPLHKNLIRAMNVTDVYVEHVRDVLTRKVTVYGQTSEDGTLEVVKRKRTQMNRMVAVAPGSTDDGEEKGVELSVVSGGPAGMVVSETSVTEEEREERVASPRQSLLQNEHS